MNAADTVLNLPEPAVATRVLLVPSDRFFVQAVPLDPGIDAATQAALALEEVAPFPLAQLYHGHVVAADQSQALVFAAYRRRFSGAETADWPAAGCVVPAFVALLAGPPGGAALVVHTDGPVLTGIAWDGQSTLPSLVLAQAGSEPPTEALRAEFTARLRKASGLDQAPVRFLEGEIQVAHEAEGRAVFQIGDSEMARLPPAALASADVRDKDFLVTRRREGRRDLGLWHGLVVTGAILGLAAALDVAALALGRWTSRVREEVGGAAEQVRRIETAQTLATRVEDLSRRQFRPLEMLALVSERRPRPVQFLRATSKGLYTLEVEAQTPNATDVGAYEVALRTLDGLAQVETRDLRTRDGVTSFVLEVTFKAGVLRPEGGPS